MRGERGRVRRWGEAAERGAGVVATQFAVGLCLAAVVAWGVAAFAGLESVVAEPGNGGALSRISWSLVVGLYVGLMGVAASVGALALGWLPVFALAQLAWLLAPPNRRWMCATIYPAPVLAFTAAAWLIPQAAVLREPLPMALGLAFAAIPSLVLAVFHMWVLGPDPVETPAASPLQLRITSGADNLLAEPLQRR